MVPSFLSFEIVCAIATVANPEIAISGNLLESNEKDRGAHRLTNETRHEKKDSVDEYMEQLIRVYISITQW